MALWGSRVRIPPGPSISICWCAVSSKHTNAFFSRPSPCLRVQIAERGVLYSTPAASRSHCKSSRRLCGRLADWEWAVESTKKLVVEARLKRSGTRWTRPHVDPMLALRNIVCSDRWEEAWPQIVCTLRQQEQQRRTARRHRWQATTPQPPAPPPVPATPQHVTATPCPTSQSTKPSAPTAPRQPATNHPWRRMPIDWARFEPVGKNTNAKP